MEHKSLKKHERETGLSKAISSMDSGSERPMSEERKRMLQAAVHDQSPSTSKGVKRGRGNGTPPQGQLSSLLGWNISSSDESEQNETEQALRKVTKRKRSSEEDDTQSKASVSPVKKARRTAVQIQPETSEESSDAEECRVPKVAPSRAKRVPCPYGKDCYRKNLQHKIEYKHPAESDDDSFTDKSASVDDDSDHLPHESDESSTARKQRKALPRKQGEKSKQALRTGTKRKRCSAEDDTESNASASPVKKAPSRVPCAYGKLCYRKNLFHFKECSHPGDSDYEAAEEVDHGVDERPECPYGTSCYRKNRLHKKMYKHTAEEYAESDDSFIDDESESVSDESEYLPSESDESVNTKKERKALLALLRK